MPPQATYGTLKVSTGKVIVQEEDPERLGCVAKCYPSGFKRELKALTVLAFPAIVTQMFQYVTGPIALMFCGHLGEEELASVALALAFTNVAAITIANGLATACDTLFSQVYGSRMRKNLGIILQRSLIILCLSLVPCWVLHLNMEAFLRLLGQEPIIARNAGIYMQLFMPGALAFFIYIGLLKYLQAQNIVIPNLIIGAIINVINAALHYLLLFVLDYGLQGSAIALSSSYIIQLILTALYIYFSKAFVGTWSGWSIECLRDWGEFLRLALPGLCMIVIEHYAFEVGVILSGLLGTDYLGAMSVIFQLESMLYVIPQGVGIAVSIRVGQYLGAGDHVSAKTVAGVAMTFISVLALVVASLFITLRNYLPLMFTDVPSVLAIASGIMPICAAFQVSDGLCGSGGGILRGQGRQKLGALLNILAYGVGVGIGAPLMLNTSYKLYAFWGGLCVAVTSSGVVFVIVMLTTDWKHQADLAAIRADVDEREKYLASTVKDTEEQPLLIGDTGCQDQRTAEPLLTQPTFKLVSTSQETTKSLLIKRGLVFLSALLLLILGIIFRFTYTDKLDIPTQIGVEG